MSASNDIFYNSITVPWDPRIQATTGCKGALLLYVDNTGAAAPQLFLKQDDGHSTNWGTVGGSATVPIIATNPTVVPRDGQPGDLVVSTAFSPPEMFVKTDSGITTNWSSMSSEIPVTSVDPSATATAGNLGDVLVSTFYSPPRLFIKADSGTTTNWAASGAGVTSVSASAPITSTGGATPDIAIPQSSSSADGFLASADWNIFNNKQQAGSYITALTGDVAASGPGSAAAIVKKIQGFLVDSSAPADTQFLVYNFGTSRYFPVALSGDATMSNAGAVTLAASGVVAGSYTNASITVDSKGRVTVASSGTAPVTTVTASSPLASSGGASPNLTISQSNSTTDGYLSATDWNTFNNKQPALGYTAENVANKGVANGYCPLDVSTKVPAAYLPPGFMTYKGAWDASTNTPTLADGTGTNGDTYRTSVAGTQNLGSGPQTFNVGDFVIYNGTIWQHSPGADGVSSVNGFTGAVVLTQGNLTESVSAVLTITGGTNAVWGSGTSIQISQSGAATSGYLSSTDWNTFNNKANNTLNNLGVTALNADLIPAADVARDLGSASKRFNSLHVAGIVFSGVGGIGVSSSSLTDNTGADSLNWNTRHLLNSSGVSAFEWGGPNLDAKTNKILNVVDPTSAQDAATKNYVDSNFANKTLSNLTSATSVNQALIPDVNITRDLGTSALKWNNAYIRLVTSDGTRGFNPANISMLDLTGVVASSFRFRSLNDTSGVSTFEWGGPNLDAKTHIIQNVVDPGSAQDAATKNYVDTQITGAPFANQTLSNLGLTSLNSSLIPNTDILLALGTSLKRWFSIYVGQINYGNAQILMSSSQILDSVGCVVSINWDSRALYNSSGTEVFNWNGPNLDAKTNKILNVVDPVNPQEAATKNYVDSKGFRKFSFTYADFSDPATDKFINLFNLPAKGYVEQIFIKTTTSVSGGGVALANIYVGDTSVGPTNLAGPADGIAAPSDTVYAQMNSTNQEYVKLYSFGATEQLVVYLLCDVALNTLTAGAFDIYLKVGQLP